MLFPEAESPLLRAWITKRIENTSDADADVLAEYLIALLSHDGDRAAVRSLCEAEIPDFLSEDTGKFLDDVFQAIDTKAYLLDDQRPQIPLPTSQPVVPPADNSRKRRLSTHDEAARTFDRPTKQPKRGARRGRGQGRGQDPMNHAWAAMGEMAGSSNPMEVMMHLNAMGMPMPWMQMPAPAAQQPRKRGRCRDYDRKGFCSRGTACPYDHSERKKSNRRRAPFSADGPVSDRTKTTIVVENIPEDSLEEGKVRDFFTQFGEIAELSLRPDMRLATIKYTDWESANGAYKSPKAIFDNRFVKVFWHKGAKQDKEEEEPELDMEEFQRRQDEMQKQYQERAGKRSELEKQRQDLEAQQAALLEKHQAETERLRARMAERNGGETTADMLREKLAALEQEAKILGIDTDAPRGGLRGRGRGRGRGRIARAGRHAAYAQFSLDNRPKMVAVSGVDFTDSAKDEALRHYLLNIGEFESVEPSAEGTTVTFKDRKTAERFYYSLDGKEMPGVEGTLSMGWVTAPKEDDAMSEGEVVDDGRGAAVDMDYEGAWN